MEINFLKYADGLVPAIIQDAETQKVLMLGFMNWESLEQTKALGRVTFYSRAKNRLWTKGETSGHYLNVVSILLDCDQDTLLIKVVPNGPACHTGADTCFKETNQADILVHLEKIIEDRFSNPQEKSYTSSLFKSGINKIAQKVGEEAIELVIESKDDNDDLFINEAADLLFHFLILLKAKHKTLNNVKQVLEKRHVKS